MYISSEVWAEIEKKNLSISQIFNVLSFPYLLLLLSVLLSLSSPGDAYLMHKNILQCISFSFNLLIMFMGDHLFNILTIIFVQQKNTS